MIGKASISAAKKATLTSDEELLEHRDRDQLRLAGGEQRLDQEARIGSTK